MKTITRYGRPGKLCTNTQCLWLTGLFAIKAPIRRRAHCPSRIGNAEGGQAGKPRRAGRQAPICGVAALANDDGHWGRRTAPCIWTPGDPQRRWLFVQSFPYALRLDHQTNTRHVLHPIADRFGKAEKFPTARAAMMLEHQGMA